MKQVVIFYLRNFTESKFVLVTSQSCLLWFGVNFCMSHDFSSYFLRVI